MSPRHAILASVLLTLVLSTPATAADSLKLAVSLKPERLGQRATVAFGFKITTSTGAVPPPLTEVNLRYPESLGIALSGLGLATCKTATLEAFGPQACPAEAHMGYGTALAEIPIAGETIIEHAQITVLRAPTEHGHLSLLFYATGISPVDASITFPGVLLEESPPFSLLHIKVPLVPSLPGAPDVSVAEIHGTIGPQHITYYHHIKNKFVPYNPQGVLLPSRCPRHGFAFGAELAFLDGSRTRASTSVACPGRSG